MIGKSEIHTIVTQLIQPAKELAIASLNASRARVGFQAFGAYLLKYPHNTNVDAWYIQNGTLTVKPHSTEETFAEIRAFFDEKLSGIVEYDLQNIAYVPDAERAARHPFDFNFLFKLGDNPAVDPTMFLAGPELRILSIIRPDGKSRALPGGMAPAGVKNKAIEELLEECYSGDFFIQSEEGVLSATSLMVNELPNWNIDDSLLIRAMMSDCIAFCDLPMAKKGSVKSFIANLAFSLLPDTRSDYIRAVVEAINQKEDLSRSEQASIIAHIRVLLYEKLCVTAYQDVVAILEPLMDVGELVSNDSDPRNTAYGSMTTRTVGMVVNQDVKQRLSDLGLKESAGDDAFNAHFPTLAEFCCGTPAPYSDHAALVLSALAQKIETNQIEVTADIVRQLQQITLFFQSVQPENSNFQEMLRLLHDTSQVIVSQRLSDNSNTLFAFSSSNCIGRSSSSSCSSKF